MLQMNRIMFARWDLDSPPFMDRAYLQRLGDLLQSLPLPTPGMQISGFYLEGYHFFQYIDLGGFAQVQDADVKKIENINPVLKEKDTWLPYEYHAGILLIRLPARDLEPIELIMKLNRLDEILHKWNDQVKPQLELYLSAGVGGTLRRSIMQKTIPQLQEAEYSYILEEKDSQDTGILKLPSPFENFPASLQALIPSGTDRLRILKDLKDECYLKIYDAQRIFVLEKVKKEQLGVSFFSNTISWLEHTLNVCLNEGILETPLPKDYFPKLPRLRIERNAS